MTTQDQTQSQTEKMFKVYKNTLLSCKYGFKNGKVANFVDGKYLTDNPEEQKELEEEISLGHPNLYIDPKENQVSAKDLEDPMHKLRAKMREEIIAELAQRSAETDNPNRDMGNSSQGKLTPANTQTIAPVAAGGNGISSAQLVALANKGTK